MKKSLLFIILVFCISSMWAFSFVRVRGTTYTRGEDLGTIDIRPEHEVFVTGFCISKYEVTQKEWESVMGYNNSLFKGDDYPVSNVSWWEAVEFCNKLSIKEGLRPCYDLMKGEMIKCNYDASGYRLPSEAEWELAAIGGSDKNRKLYSGSDIHMSVAWADDTIYHTVGTKKPNELGIYDMSGNVAEWCNDWFEKDYYSLAVLIKKNPKGASYGDYKSFRGGSYRFGENRIRVSFRNFYKPRMSSSKVGFRVVRSFL